jgi:hypothetical protein
MSTVGSGTPVLEDDNKIHVRGSYAETEFAQNTRKLVTGKHLRTLSCAYREKKGEKGVRRELINASFVLVPSNTDCVVVDSKSYEIPKDDDKPSPANMPKSLKQKDIDPTPQERAQMVHDLALDLGAQCTSDEMFGDMKKYSGSVLPGGFTAEVELDTEKDYSVLEVKDAVGNVLMSHRFSQQAPEAHGDEPSDSTADPAKDAEALARAKAAAMQMETRHLVNIEGN